jgi:hypothetical protein
MVNKCSLIKYVKYKTFNTIDSTLYALLGAIGGSSAIMTLMAVSIDRYNVIVYPLNPSRSTTKKKSYIMILLVWIHTFCISFIPIFGLFDVPQFSPEGFLTMCSFDYLNYETANYWYIVSYATVIIYNFETNL